MTILVTGAAGFIGFHLCKRLLKEGISIVGIDNINNYYDTNLKKARLRELKKISKESEISFELYKINLEDTKEINSIFVSKKPEVVVNLAAQAGVRYSIENPSAYIQSNLVGFSNILEGCRGQDVKHLIYASSSSVYGGNKKMPFSESQGVDHPVSLYAASKKSNELMAHSYSHLYGLPTTGLRFFTVYGPWGRPDMALFLFTKAIIERKPIQVFNNGNMIRDFTFIDDIVESIVRVISKPATNSINFDSLHPNPSISWSPYKIFNIGNSKPTQLLDYISAIEEELDITADKQFMPIQPGDVPETSSDCSALAEWIGFKPNTPIKEGVGKFIQWYKEYYEN